MHISQTRKLIWSTICEQGAAWLPCEWKSRKKGKKNAFLIKSMSLSEKKVKVQLFQRYNAAVIFMTSKDTQSPPLAMVTRKYGKNCLCLMYVLSQ